MANLRQSAAPAKPILTLDFDGVLHSYTSGWQGARNIPDAPVPGALEFVVRALDHFRVAIFSSRSHQWFGRRAMRLWLHAELMKVAGINVDEAPKWWRERISRTAFADLWKDEVRFAADQVIKEILWPLHKPASMVTIDDRALRFTGKWPSIASLAAFQPWNKRPKSPGEMFEELQRSGQLSRGGGHG